MKTMRNSLFRITLPLFSLIGESQALLPPSHNCAINRTIPIPLPMPPSAAPSPQSVAGNSDCAAASASTAFSLSFISYGNYTALPGQGEDDGGLVPRQLMSMSFAVVNAANGVYTVCAFPLGHLSGGGGQPASWVDDASWQACADRRDSDGKHRFTIATGAAFNRAERFLTVNQTWFCHDEVGRLVAYTGIANGSLTMGCVDGGELGGYHVENCTAPDGTLPVTLL
ncbi:hypothetical protein F4813DRAFT_344857 [Daldinia decipiens]|uniref:uncharacterized protein n=1 Tax=Daldinia decipiens TaxID=326647 RepID=UPI0020C1D83B|nr:uncharacterized protein F4813DRAFT_344857 [Daldinia decipiens]KAI1661548.1 hypothetical protein F4813DRAFT_344857 [Daldinia decipiens]